MTESSRDLFQAALNAEETARRCAQGGDTQAAERLFNDVRIFTEQAAILERREAGEPLNAIDLVKLRMH